MTVRKERRQRGGVYWTAYRRQGRRLCKIYLGPSLSVTKARLREVADRLYTGETPARCVLPQLPTATAPTRIE